ncbi:MAG: hypothetical protein WBM29_06430 [Candidatus Deferrimicrobium sp.]
MGIWRITCSRTNSAHKAARFAEDDGRNPRCLQEKAIMLEKMAEDKLIR